MAIGRGLFCAVVLAMLGSCARLCCSGYEGSDCNTLSKTKFIGVWTATLPPTTLAYLDTISSATGAPNVTISPSFGGSVFRHPIMATVSNNIITVPQQQPDGDSIFVEGTGTMNAQQNSITWTYQIGNTPDSSIWTK